MWEHYSVNKLNKQINSKYNHLRHLTCKIKPFLWTEGCQKEFMRVKNITVLSPYNPERTTQTLVHMDASKFGGLGYILTQNRKVEEKRNLIQMGFTRMTECQTRYSIPELISSVLYGHWNTQGHTPWKPNK